MKLCKLSLMLVVSFPPLATAHEADPQIRLKSEHLAPAEYYAKSYGVSLSEADRRLLIMEEARRVQDAARARHPDTFGGLYVEHSPSFRVNVLFTNEPRGRLAALTTDADFVARKTDRSLSELKATQSIIGEDLNAAGLQFMSRVDLTDSSVHVYIKKVPEGARVMNTFASAASFVRVHETTGFIDTTALRPTDVHGSLKATNPDGGYCTSGFGVKYGERWGFSTAGHCHNSLTLRTSPDYALTFEAEMMKGSVDLQWHSIPDDSKRTYRSTPQLKTGTRNLIIRAVRPIANNLVGDVVCKYGYTTYETCGTIQDLEFENNFGGVVGKFVRVRRDNGRTMTDFGDSGGPVYANTPLAGSRYNTAVGLVHGRGAAGTAYVDDMFFMPTDHFSALGLRILTAADVQ